MGVYTWVGKMCCDKELQFQGNGGPKEYGEYDVDAVPYDVAQNIDGDTQECPHCMRRYTIQRKKEDYKTVPMEIVCDNEDEISGQQEQEDDEMEERLQRIERQLGLK